jgi:hypothetical protein
LKLADVVERTIIDPRKLTHYALDPDSLHGRDKAILFEKLLGFTKDNHVELMRQLEQRCLHAEAILHSVDELGHRYTIDVPIEGAAGQQAVVRTGWIVLADQPTVAHLVTLYVRKQ